MSYTIKRAKAPVEAVILNLTEQMFNEVIDAFRQKYPNYYNSAVNGNYGQDDIMGLLVAVAKELGKEL